MPAHPKRAIATAAICSLALSGALLSGCAASNSDQEILDKLDQMENDIATLKENQASSSSTDDANASATGSTGTDASASSGEQAASIEDALADLETRAAAAVQTASETAVPEAAADRPQAYFDAKAPLEELDREAEQLEDRAEAQYREGAIERDALWEYDKRIDAVEDSLDAAEDDLERRMGVDD